MGAIVSGIGTALGLGGGVQAPQIHNPTNPGQVNAAYENTQQNVAQQQALLAALQQQGGIQNQSQVYDQLQQVASGQGPNPAQAMLANATGQNVANQAALAASQRGGSANAGLIARQAGQIGANAQQQAIGQGAALQAQQSLGALGQAGGMANQQVANQLGAQQQAAGTALSQQGNLIGAQQGFNQAQNQQYGMQLQNQQEQGKNLLNTAGSVLNAAGPAIKSALPLIGGMFAGPAGAAGGAAVAGSLGGGSGASQMFAFADGGQVPASPKSHFGQYAHGGKVPAMVSPGEKYLTPQAVSQVAQGASPMAKGQTIPGKAKVPGAKDDYTNDTVPKTLETGGVVLPRSVTQSKDADQKAREFVAAILKQKAMKR